jgi:hypothetical protein
MPIRSSRGIAIGLALAAPALHAQASDALYTRFSALSGWEMRSYSFDAPSSLAFITKSTSQWRVPVVAVAPVGRRLSVDLTTNYASSRLETDAGTVTLDGLTDTQVRAVYTLSRDRVVTSLSLNLPTGPQDLTPQEFQVAGALGSSYLSFPVTGAGTGFSATGGLAWVRPVGAWNVGLSGSYRYQGAFTPIADTAGGEYDPGSEFRVRGGIDRLFGQRTRMTLGLTFSTFSTDRLPESASGASTYKPGPRLIAEFALARAMGRTTLTFVAWDFHRTAGKVDNVSDPGKRENVLNAELRWSVPVGRRAQIEPLAAYRQYDLEAFAGGRLYSGAVTARLGLADRLSASVTGRFDTGWVAGDNVGRADVTGFGLTALLRFTR